MIARCRSSCLIRRCVFSLARMIEDERQARRDMILRHSYDIQVRQFCGFASPRQSDSLQEARAIDIEDKHIDHERRRAAANQQRHREIHEKKLQDQLSMNEKREHVRRCVLCVSGCLPPPTLHRVEICRQHRRKDYQREKMLEKQAAARQRVVDAQEHFERIRQQRLQMRSVTEVESDQLVQTFQQMASTGRFDDLAKE